MSEKGWDLKINQSKRYNLESSKNDLETYLIVS